MESPGRIWSRRCRRSEMKQNEYSRLTPSAVKRIYGFKNARSLGQNFLNDGRVIDAIIEGSGAGPEDLVIEIGPGMGVLTSALAEAAATVVAVEIDSRLIPLLRDTLAGYRNITILNEDIMKTDLSALIRRYHDPAGGGAVRIVGNIPYYITTPILMKLLEDRVEAETITLMMQKEVADRIEAQPGGRTYGALSVAVGYYCSVVHVTDVPRECFSPQPKVDSAVIRLDRRMVPPAEVRDEALFFETVKAGFGKRRKTLVNALTGMRSLTKETARDLLAQAGIEPSRRAETLSIPEFAALADAIAEYIDNQH